MAVEMRSYSRKDWLQKRKSYIGGSDAASIIGLNPWKTNVDLWEIKTGKSQEADLSDNAFVKYGHNAEQYLRMLFCLDFPEYEVYFLENNMWTNTDFPYAHASLDGWLKDRDGRFGVLEIKTTNIKSSAQSEKWKDQIPQNYFCQILHYLAVTKFSFAVLKAQLKTEIDGDVYLTTKHYKIERSDVEDDIAYLMEKEAEFAEYIKANKQPPLILPEV